MKAISVLCAAFLAVSSLCQAQTWNLDFGDDKAQMAFYNRWNSNEKVEDVPFGPMSFRVINNKLWVLDSVKGRVCCFDEKNKLLKDYVIPGLKGNILLEDFALVGDDLSKPDAVWVANTSDNMIRKISTINGKVLAQFGGLGNKPGKIIQVSRLEADAGGRLYVADIGRGKLSVFTSTGAFLREYPWQGNGFVVDRYANLHLIQYSDKAGYFYRVYSPKGSLTSSTHIGFLNNSNVTLHSVEKDGSLLLTMNPTTGFKGKLDFVKINRFGDILEKDSLTPIVPMNRYIHDDNNKIFVVDADFESAPISKFIVKPFEWKKTTAVPASSSELKKRVIATVPDEMASKLIGMRVYKNQAFIMASNGKFITVDLAKGETTAHKIKSAKVVDFDIFDGKILYLNDQGMICGNFPSKCSKGTYDSCKIDVCDQGAILSGGSNAYFLPKTASSSFVLPDFLMLLPINNGLVWAMNLNKENTWELTIHDCFGNLMGKGFKFNKTFNPASLEIGPKGVDGELLVSSKDGKKRSLAFIGTNGRMFWKVTGPEKVCARDVAFGPLGELLVLEKTPDGKIVLSHLIFANPQG